MPFKKGTDAWKQRKKHGRDTLEQEIETIKEKIEEEVTQEALLKLAKRVVHKKLSSLDTAEDPKSQDIKDIAMPIVVKGITERKEVTETITGNIKHEHSENVKNAKSIMELAAEYEKKLRDELSK